jgi:hypothetical protein
MANLSTYYPAPITAADLGLGAGSNATFGSIQNTPIGSTTASSGSFTTLTANNGTITASAPVLDISQTWNNSGVNFTAVRINIIPTAAQFGGGLSNLLDIQNNGGAAFFVRTNGNANASGFTTFGGGALTLNGQAVLLADASNALAQRSGTNAQTFNIYNTFTSATNHERGFLKWSSNVFQIGTEKGSGGGSARALELQTDGVTRLTVQTGGTVALTSHLTAENGFIRIASAQAFQWLNRSKIYSLSDGNVGLYNAGESSFNLLQFGGTTTSFPALKRSSTVLQARLANDSDFCPLQGQLRTHANAVTETITADKTLTLYDAAGTAYKVPCVAA